MRAAREGIRARPRDRGVMTCLVLVSQHNTQHDNDIMAPPRPGQRSQIALTRLAEVILITPRPDGPDRPRTDIKRLAFIFIFVGPVFFFTRNSFAGSRWIVQSSSGGLGIKTADQEDDAVLLVSPFLFFSRRWLYVL